MLETGGDRGEARDAECEQDQDLVDHASLLNQACAALHGGAAETVMAGTPARPSPDDDGRASGGAAGHVRRRRTRTASTIREAHGAGNRIDGEKRRKAMKSGKSRRFATIGRRRAGPG
ncbi:hypothetical protein, partial [Burkholderia pseudomultivorans]